MTFAYRVAVMSHRTILVWMVKDIITHEHDVSSPIPEVQTHGSPEICVRCVLTRSSTADGVDNRTRGELRLLDVTSLAVLMESPECS